MEFRLILSTVILLAIIFTILRLFLKRKIRTAKLLRWWRLISDRFHDHQILNVPEFNNDSVENHLFKRVKLYLNSLVSLEDSDGVDLFSGFGPNDVVLAMNKNQTVVDMFLDARLQWTAFAKDGGARSFRLKVRKRDKRRVLRTYLQHIHVVSDEIEERKKEIRLWSSVQGRWRSSVFTHPATMETIAMDATVKNRIGNDIETFLKSKQYYHRLGRVWRRSYLLYGPSGTGKSSFVAALARSLSYDVYDVDLAKVTDDSELKNLLLQTTPRSLILIEDFDKYVNGNKKTSVSLSGLMNFMDGVVNSCCDERVMVFTMISKDELDPVLLRPGRVDVHLHFPMCDFNNFKNLANNYLGVKEHKLFPQVEEIFSSGASISPAEVGELLMVNRSSPNRALKSVISALQTTSKSGPIVVSGDSSCKGTPNKDGFGAKSGHVYGSGESNDGGSSIGKDSVIEIKKLYGLLRRKSNVRVSDSFDLGT